MKGINWQKGDQLASCIDQVDNAMWLKASLISKKHPNWMRFSVVVLTPASILLNSAAAVAQIAEIAFKGAGNLFQGQFKTSLDCAVALPLAGFIPLTRISRVMVQTLFIALVPKTFFSVLYSNYSDLWMEHYLKNRFEGSVRQSITRKILTKDIAPECELWQDHNLLERRLQNLGTKQAEQFDEKLKKLVDDLYVNKKSVCAPLLSVEQKNRFFDEMCDVACSKKSEVEKNRFKEKARKFIDDDVIRIYNLRVPEGSRSELGFQLAYALERRVRSTTSDTCNRLYNTVIAIIYKDIIDNVVEEMKAYL